MMMMMIQVQFTLQHSDRFKAIQTANISAAVSDRYASVCTNSMYTGLYYRCIFVQCH